MMEDLERCAFLNAFAVPEHFRGKDAFISKGNANDMEGDVEVWVNVTVPVWWVVPLLIEPTSVNPPGARIHNHYQGVECSEECPAFQDQIEEQIKRWRSHPNYRKICKCGHPSVLHVNGEGRCGHVKNREQESDCDCQAFQIANVAKTQRAENPVQRETPKAPE